MKNPVEYLSNPTPPSVPKPYKLVAEVDPQENFRHYAIVDTRTRRKLDPFWAFPDGNVRWNISFLPSVKQPLSAAERRARKRALKGVQVRDIRFPWKKES